MNDIFEKIQADFDEFMKSAKEFIEKEKAKQIDNTDKKVRRWKPENGDDYYCVMSNGNVKTFIWNTDVADYGHYKLGNCFKTEEEAQKELDRRLAEQELLDMCDWDGGEKVYLIRYGDQGDVFDCIWFDYLYSPYRFASKESCKKAIKTLGTEKLKLIFRID